MQGSAKHALPLAPPPVSQSHQQYHELLVGEENKRKALLDIIYTLEVGGPGLA